MTNYAQYMEATGSIPQANGSSWIEDTECGYDKHFKYEVVYAHGPYTGSDEQWRGVGIPHYIIDKLNKDSKKKGFKFGWTFRVEDEDKKAIISFSSKNYAFWFKLKTQYKKI